MRKLLLGAMCCAACGSPLDEYVGSYSVAGLSNKLSLNGAPPPTKGPTGPPALRVFIPHTPPSMAVSVLPMVRPGFSKAPSGLTGVKTSIGPDPAAAAQPRHTL